MFTNPADDDISTPKTKQIPEMRRNVKNRMKS